ncbi:hypothetical protein [Spiroplasma endosymbiont of Crioceris asparagi]|uniref:hypothetical protein n=1 Tax=Spiroplasma endosymbiont of Crioceris asparagi TaxID=3066286 RepID=UPI0030CCA6A9
MKKLIGLLGSFGMAITSIATTISCGNDKALIKDLTKLIINKELGMLEDAKSETIISAVLIKNLNSGLTKDDIVATVDATNNIANITAFDSSKFVGSVNVVFTIKPNLLNLIKHKDLGTLDDAKSETIIKAVLNKNWESGLTSDDIKAIVDEGNKKATIISADKNKLTGSVDVIFAIKPKLSEVIKKTDLGMLDFATPKIIIAAVIANNPNLGLTNKDITAEVNEYYNMATIIANTSSKFIGSVSVTFTLKQELLKVIKNRDLGILDYAKQDIIIAAVLAKNPNSGLISKDITVEIDELNNAATITAKKSSNFIGSVDVIFNIKSNLTKLIKNTKLGALDDAKPETVIAAVIAKNPDSGLTKEDIDAEVDEKNNKAIITAVDSTKFIEEVEVTFIVKPNLVDIIKIKYLGALDDAKPETVIAAVVAKNPDSGLTKEDIKAEVDEKNNKATIAVKNTDKFIGSAEVTFKIKTNDLAKVVVNIDENTTYVQLFENVKSQLIKDVVFNSNEPTNITNNDFFVTPMSQHLGGSGHSWKDKILEKDTAYFDFNPTEKGKTKLKNSLRVIVKRNLNLTWISKDDPNKNLIQEDQKSKTFKIILKEYDDLNKYDLRIIHFPALESEIKQANSDKTTWKLNWSDINTTDNTKPIGNFVNLSWCDGSDGHQNFKKDDFDKVASGSTIEELKFESENLNDIYKILFIKG